MSATSPPLNPHSRQSSPFPSRRQLFRVASARAAAMVGIFAASAALESTSAPSIPVLTFMVFCCASVPALLGAMTPCHLSSHGWRSLALPAPAAVAAVAALFRVSMLLFGLEILGPTRVLVVSGAVAPIFVDLASLSNVTVLDRRRTMRSILIVFLCLSLVAYDATGGRVPAEKATLVSRRVLKTRAGHVVEAKFHSLANRLRPSLEKPRLLYKQFANISSQDRDPSQPLQPPPAAAHSTGAITPAAPAGVSGRSGIALTRAESLHSSGAVLEHGASQPETRSQYRLDENVSVKADAMGVAIQRRLLAIIQEEEPERPALPGPDDAGADLAPDTRDTTQQKSDASKDVTVDSVERLSNVKSYGTNLDAHGSITLASGFAGVSLALVSFLTAPWEAGPLDMLANEVGSRSLAHALCILGAALLSLPPAVMSLVWTNAHADWGKVSSLLSPDLPIFALCFISAPHFIGADEAITIGAPAAVVTSLTIPAGNGGGSVPQVTDLSNAGRFLSRNAFAQLVTVIFLFPFVRGGAVGFGATIAPFSFSLWLATIGLAFLLHVNWRASDRDWSRSLARSGMTVGGAGGPLLSLGRASRGSLNSIPHFRRNLGATLSKVAAFIAQSRGHKASWQVFNFLVMQSGMVIVETTYAFMTDSVGLISISADNLFCCISLGAGLFAIRTTGSAKRSSAYSFGLARLESLCGFVNGILLIVVAILLMLEAVDRVLNPEFIDTNHIFAVCLFGIVGNGIGLVFFPPESRRENHNVQSIYLHIWANTLAYVGISASTVILGVNPEWSLTELGVASIVAALVVGSAIPLLVRSSRLLMNYPAAEKMTDVRETRSRLSRIDGVVQVLAFKVWNLTPTSMVVTAHLLLSPTAVVHERDVLLHARALCAKLGASPRQTTIQITRGEKLVSPHVRSRSLGSYDVEGVLGLQPSASPGAGVTDTGHSHQSRAECNTSH